MALKTANQMIYSAVRQPW